MLWNNLPVSEKANVITHAIGFVVFGTIGSIFLISNHALTNIPYLSMVVFIISAMMVYLSSTVYHLILDQKKKQLWRNIDHIAIFFLIGGTYQPFVMLYYGGQKGIIFMAIMWSLIVIGVLYKLLVKNSWGWISTIFYLGLGWMVVFIIKPVFESINLDSLIWLVIGGISYTLGVFFYKKKNIPFNHAIWHLFVLFGTLAHYISITKGINVL